MPDRKHTPDIMSELMAGQSASTPVKQQASKPVKQQASKPVKQQASKPVKQQASKPVKKQASKPEPAAAEESIKATFYLSPGAIEALEQLWMKRRQKAEPQQRGRITKSHLVEEAISNLAVSDLKAK